MCCFKFARSGNGLASRRVLNLAARLSWYQFLGWLDGWLMTQGLRPRDTASCC